MFDEQNRQDTLAAIEEQRNLEDDWDGYGSSAPSDKTLNKMRTIIESLPEMPEMNVFVGPYYIQISFYHFAHLDVYDRKDDTVSYLHVLSGAKEDKYEEGECTVEELLNTHVTWIIDIAKKFHEQIQGVLNELHGNSWVGQVDEAFAIIHHHERGLVFYARPRKDRHFNWTARGVRIYLNSGRNDAFKQAVYEWCSVANLNEVSVTDMSRAIYRK